MGQCLASSWRKPEQARPQRHHIISITPASRLASATSYEPKAKILDGCHVTHDVACPRGPWQVGQRLEGTLDPDFGCSGSRRDGKTVLPGALPEMIVFGETTCIGNMSAVRQPGLSVTRSATEVANPTCVALTRTSPPRSSVNWARPARSLEASSGCPSRLRQTSRTNTPPIGSPRASTTWTTTCASRKSRRAHTGSTRSRMRKTEHCPGIQRIRHTAQPAACSHIPWVHPFTASVCVVFDCHRLARCWRRPSRRLSQDRIALASQSLCGVSGGILCILLGRQPSGHAASCTVDPAGLQPCCEQQQCGAAPTEARTHHDFMALPSRLAIVSHAHCPSAIWSAPYDEPCHAVAPTRAGDKEVTARTRRGVYRQSGPLSKTTSQALHTKPRRQ